MPQSINTNLASLNAQRNLNTSQGSLATSLQRLSSGLRINSAKDDAAGLAISERMTSQIRGLNQASRNANDAISLAQTSEGNLAEISNVLQRMREISVQSANDTNTDDDRTSLQNEMTSLTEEIDRIANAAQFNGKNLLDGTVTAFVFQVGANQNQTISVSMSSAKVSDLGLSGSALVAGSSGTAAKTIGAGALLGGQTIGTLADDGVSYVGGVQSGATSTLAIANAINAISSSTGVTATAQTTSAASTATAGYATAIDDGDVKINGVNIGAIAASANSADRNSAMILAINAKSGETGVTAAAASSTTYILTAKDGRNIDIETNSLATNVTGFADNLTLYGQLTLHANKDIAVTVENIAGIGNGSTGATYAKSGSATIDISSQIAAGSAISQIDDAITTINEQRAALGTVQTRFESVIANLNTSSENLSAARGRIRDTDFATETANLTRNQVLQQAGVAMLAQANALPNIVLSLLK